MVVQQHLQAMPEERMLLSSAMFQQTQLAGALQNLTPKQRDFLRFRSITATDIEARHLAGTPRGQNGVVMSMRPCGCRKRTPGWIDLREQTVLNWKKKASFRVAYDALLNEPLIFAATRLEQLAPNAVQVYADLLDPEGAGSMSDKRQAAKDVLQSTGLIKGDGQHRSSNAVQETMQFRIARERAIRGQALGDSQRQLLRDGGIDPDAVSRQAVTIRTLDGDDVVFEPARDEHDGDKKPDEESSEREWWDESVPAVDELLPD